MRIALLPDYNDIKIAWSSKKPSKPTYKVKNSDAIYTNGIKAHQKCLRKWL